MCAQVLAGSVVAQGETEAVISATGGSTFFGKTVALLAEPEEVGHLRKVWPIYMIASICFHGSQRGICWLAHPSRLSHLQKAALAPQMAGPPPK